jgi:hypothetical protein
MASFKRYTGGMLKTKIASLALLASLGAAAPAAATEYPGQRPAPPLVMAAVQVAEGYWDARGVLCEGCEPLKVYVADDLGGADIVAADGRGSREERAIWIWSGVLRDIQEDRDAAAASLGVGAMAPYTFERLCRVAAHEDGHVRGLGHDSANGVMSGDEVPWACAVWAREAAAPAKGRPTPAATATAARTRSSRAAAARSFRRHRALARR